ncbi:MAG: methylenetetrahydrofolate reductase [Thermosediminibacterales bacterium]|nr:methylenetetrahydrofolate reductase [Thermosediminibacterales bacterium]
MKLKTFKQKLKNGKFLITTEISSPKGTNFIKQIKEIEVLEGFVDAVNICDCPMANMRMSPIAMAKIITESTGMETIPHFTCRDRNIIGLQSELLGAWALGIKNVLAITGDPPTKGDHPGASGVFDLDSKGLVKLVKGLNQGRDHSGNMLEGATDFTIGVVANPCAEDLNAEIEKLAAKIEAGADFIQTQPVYEEHTLYNFLEKVEPFNIPVLIGILPLKSYKMAVNFNEKVEGINIPLAVIDRMKKGPEEGIKISIEFIRKIISRVNGIHLMPLGNYRLVKQIITQLGISKDRNVLHGVI